MSKKLSKYQRLNEKIVKDAANWKVVRKNNCEHALSINEIDFKRIFLRKITEYPAFNQKDTDYVWKSVNYNMDGIIENIQKHNKGNDDTNLIVKDFPFINSDDGIRQNSKADDESIFHPPSLSTYVSKKTD